MTHSSQVQYSKSRWNTFKLSQFCGMIWCVAAEQIEVPVHVSVAWRYHGSLRKLDARSGRGELALCDLAALPLPAQGRHARDLILLRERG